MKTIERWLSIPNLFSAAAYLGLFLKLSAYPNNMESFGQCRRASMPHISGWQRPLQRLQAPPDLSDGLGIVLVADGMKPIGRSGGDVALDIIEEDDLVWLHP